MKASQRRSRRSKKKPAPGRNCSRESIRPRQPYSAFPIVDGSSVGGEPAFVVEHLLETILPLFSPPGKPQLLISVAKKRSSSVKYTVKSDFFENLVAQTLYIVQRY